MHKIFCDILISGAGIIGSTLALKLVQSGFRVIIIDSAAPCLLTKKSTPDLRVSAINISSIKLLEMLNILHKIPSFYRIPFNTLEVWECLSSKVTFDSVLLNTPYMGFIIENIRLQSALWESFLDYKKLIFYSSCTLQSACYDGKYWELKLNNGKIINSFLLIGSDGKNSLVRNLVGIRVTSWQYRQFCMLLSIKFTKNQKGKIWQIFTPFGPRGFLPLHDHWGSLMWYDNIKYIHKLQKLPISMLENIMQKKFGEQLGAIKLCNKIYFSLIRQHAKHYVKPGVALVGDSAHVINPLAGQGINLGFRDISVLVNILDTAKNNGKSWNTLEVLQQYQNQRWYDNHFMQIGIDCLYATFSNNTTFIKWIRNTSFMVLERSPRIKKRILQYALGLIKF